MREDGYFNFLLMMRLFVAIAAQLALVGVHTVERRGRSIIQHHMPLYLLSSNMDQCLALTSAVTALPAVSVPTDEDGDEGSGLAVNLSRRRN